MSVEIVHHPASAGEIAAIVATSFAAGLPLEVRGGGTKGAIGRPMQTGATLDISGLTGITLYEPAEMVIGCRAGTPVAELEATLAAKGQMLPFEPADYRQILGTSGEPTVGGMVATNNSGPRRITAGACRDSLIGVAFINGKGEAIINGGRVMKNVTGYDLVKLSAGAWGTLGVLTDVIFKVLPKPETSTSLVYAGLEPGRAAELLRSAMGTPFEVSGAATISGKAVLRLENFAPSVAYRSEKLARALAEYGQPEILTADASEALWRTIRDAVPMAGAGALWRISTAPDKGVALVEAALGALPATDWDGADTVLTDWSGGLVWLRTPDSLVAAEAVRTAVAAHGGHATLIRASASTRLAVAPFEPEAAPVAMLTRKIKEAFDPAGILNLSRLGEGR